ncbi:PLP-dependent aminotransferase family protein [Actinophytocola xanthii]|uniref:Aminotransferase class I/classII domain-containing protein n=1 Tax=Actinophytocola xanthii TaxID=1912961 RepID=A0A1Q8CJZ3_9PSEU|nr:hypothetical protein [Actinophytocola xanthii]OLF14688.1 hypothetical protein BU204_25695 [Actinophytocola xanthii]
MRSDYYTEQLDGLGEELGRLHRWVLDAWRGYRGLCERTGMRTNPLVVPATEARIAALGEEIHEFRASTGAVGWQDYLDRCEVFRVLVRELANLATTHDWQSPAYESSTRPHVFHTGDHGYRGLLGYRRVHHPILTELELRYRTELGYTGDDLACYLTSSGMGAFTVVENWLVRDRLDDGDLVAYMARTYFESRDQLAKLKGVATRAVDVTCAADVVDFVRAAGPAVFVVEPVNNEDLTRLVPLDEIVRGLGRLRLDRDTYLVVDTSMSAGGEGRLFDIEELRRNPRLHLVQIESLLKYRQQGLDRVNAGVVLVESRFAREVFVQRERCGAFLPDLQSFEMLAHGGSGHDRRMRRIKHNGEVFCAELRDALPPELREDVSLTTPIAATHQDHEVYRRSYRYLGGVVPLSFGREVGMDVLLRVIATTLELCAREGTVLHHSTSFGFNSTHIGVAATGGARLTNPFLRVSVGEDPESCVRRIARHLAAALTEHLVPAAVELTADLTVTGPAAEVTGR